MTDTTADGAPSYAEVAAAPPAPAPASDAAPDVALEELISIQVPQDDTKHTVKQLITDSGNEFYKSCCFHQVTKPELIPLNKEVVVEDIETGTRLFGEEARTALGLPERSTKKFNLTQELLDKHKVFMESQSYNRVCAPGSTLLYRPRPADYTAPKTKRKSISKKPSSKKRKTSTDAKVDVESADHDAEDHDEHDDDHESGSPAEGESRASPETVEAGKPAAEETAPATNGEAADKLAVEPATPVIKDVEMTDAPPLDASKTAPVKAAVLQDANKKPEAETPVTDKPVVAEPKESPKPVEINAKKSPALDAEEKKAPALKEVEVEEPESAVEDKEPKVCGDAKSPKDAPAVETTGAEAEVESAKECAPATPVDVPKSATGETAPAPASASKVVPTVVADTKETPAAPASAIVPPVVAPHAAPVIASTIIPSVVAPAPVVATPAPAPVVKDVEMAEAPPIVPPAEGGPVVPGAVGAQQPINVADLPIKTGTEEPAKALANGAAPADGAGNLVQ